MQAAAPLGQRALRGLILMLAQNVVSRASGLVSQLALAALLRPADFGVIGLAYTVTTIASTLTNIGIDDVLMQRKRSLRLWSGAAFWISFGLALGMGLIVVLISPIAASVYKTPDLVGLLAVLALSMPIGALCSVPGMVLRSQMRFDVFAGFGAIEIVAQASMTVGLAWAGFGAYSFVIPAPILAAVRALVWWRAAAFGVSLRPQIRRWRYVVGNTAASFTSRILVAFMSQADYMVLGFLTNQEIVGGYYFGFRLAAQPLWMLAGNFASVLYPVLIELKSDPVRQGEAAYRASNLLLYCLMPVAMVQAAVAEPLIGGFFGQKWLASIPVIQLLSLGLAMDAVSWVAGALLAARGEFVLGLRYVAVQTPLFVALAWIGAKLHQSVGVAVAVCVFYTVTQPVFVYGVYRRIGITAGGVARLYLWPTAFAAAAVGAGLAASTLPPLAAYPLGRVAVICAVGGVLYLGLLRWRVPEVWRELTRRLTSALGGFGARFR